MDRAVTDSEERERDQNIHKSIKKKRNKTMNSTKSRG